MVSSNYDDGDGDDDDIGLTAIENYFRWRITSKVSWGVNNNDQILDGQ